MTRGDHHMGERVGDQTLRSVRCLGTYASGAVGVCWNVSPTTLFFWDPYKNVLADS
jgi:hypothetical protein